MARERIATRLARSALLDRGKRLGLVESHELGTGRCESDGLDELDRGRSLRRFAQLRREPGPVKLIGPGERVYWSLVRHADVVAASRNPEIFSNQPDPFTVRGNDPDAPSLPLLINLDPPEHTRRRQLVNKGFTPRRITRLTDRIREIVDEQLQRVSGMETFDFVTDLAVELPLQVIAELLGIPPQDRAKVFSWTEQMMSGDDAEFANSQEEIMAALGAMYGYAENLCAERREAPGADLMSALIAGRARRRAALAAGPEPVLPAAAQRGQRDHAQPGDRRGHRSAGEPRSARAAALGTRENPCRR